MIKKFCVLIPSYNEARAIGGLVEKLRGRGIATVIVDDGSSDSTGSIALSRGAVVIRNEKNIGKGASMRTGFARILNDGFDAVLVMDGDGQHRVEDIDNFLKKMGETNAGIIVGNRMMSTSSMPLIRIYTNRFMSFLLSKMTNQRIPDSQCGFKLIRRDVLEAIKLESSNYDIESELLIKASRAGFKIESIPVQTIYESEKSRINPIIDTIRFIKFMARMILERAKRL